ncbi:homogentisate phytyltransferase [Tumidithrix helvetica PCC 7403]|uniref:homogentisate phytyltransferase n=1 Tax=Tumidithrix helvetica TaxID=3457545 RepID=UPI003C8CCFD6
MQKITQKFVAFWQFGRPHTIIGTCLSTIALFAIALVPYKLELTLAPIPSLLWAAIACLCGNVYIVGLNQLEDVEIDKINKPYLPLASGDFSIPTGRAIVSVMGILAVAIAIWQGAFLAATVSISLFLGTIYSLPPIRLKRFPFWAAFCIFTVRGIVINLGLFLHFQQVFSHLFANTIDSIWSIPSSVWGLTGFVLIFTYVIAIFKDMPDTEGDAKFRITTLTLTLGQVAVFNLSRQILAVLYLGFAILSFTPWLTGVHAIALAISHGFLLSVLWWQSLQVDLSDRTSITDFYQLIWKFFYLEYIIFPVVCIFA